MKTKVTKDAKGHLHIRLAAGVHATVARGAKAKDSLPNLAQAKRNVMQADGRLDTMKRMAVSAARAVVEAEKDLREAKAELAQVEREEAAKARNMGKDVKPCSCKH